MKKWIQDRLKSINHVVYLIRGVFSWKATLAYIALMIVSRLSDQDLWGFLVSLVLIGIIDIVAYKQGMAVERVWSAKR